MSLVHLDNGNYSIRVDAPSGYTITLLKKPKGGITGLLLGFGWII